MATETTRPRRLRTWSAFGEVRRVPSEYEILTHDLNYTVRKGRHTALESNPTTPANMWLLTYRDRSPLQVDDWNAFRDPDELTYRKYVTLQDEQTTVVDGIIDEFEAVEHDANLDERWAKTLGTLFSPARYPFHALQMTQSYLGQIAPSSYITNCAAFAAADLLRMVSLVAYRTRQLQLTQPEVGFALEERQVWEHNPDWQPARKALEEALVAYDWGETLTGVNLVLRPTIDEVLLHQFGLVAEGNGDTLTWLLLSNLALDSERSVRWSTELARFAVRERPDNAEAFARWIRRWEPKADAAAEGLSRLVAALPEHGRDSDAVMQAARNARERVLATAGLAGTV